MGRFMGMYISEDNQSADTSDELVQEVELAPEERESLQD